MGTILSDEKIKELRKVAALSPEEPDDGYMHIDDVNSWSEEGINRLRASLARLVLKEAGIPLEE